MSQRALCNLMACTLLLSRLPMAGAVTTEARDVLQPLRVDDGVVVLSLTANISSELTDHLDEVRLRRIGGPNHGEAGKDQQENFLVRKTSARIDRDTSLFMAALPLGDYELSAFTKVTRLLDTETSQWKTVRTDITLSRPTQERLGTFTVLPGQTADLGRLILTQLNRLTLLGRSRVVVSNRADVGRLIPAYQGVFALPAARAWAGPPQIDDHAEELALARPTGAYCPDEWGDGRSVAASKFGSVIVRSTAGLWTVINGETIDSLTCVLPVDLPEASLFAVGVNGQIVKLAPGAGRLTPVDTGKVRFENLVYIAGNTKAGWYVVDLKDNLLTVYHALQMERGDWQAVHSDKLQARFFDSPTGFWPTRGASGFAYVLSDGVHALDYASGKWEYHARPNSGNILGAGFGAKGEIGVRGSALGNGFLSTDTGVTWKEIDIPLALGMQSFGGPMQLPDSSVLITAARKEYGTWQFALHATHDLGKHWHQVGDLPAYSRLVVLPSGNLLAVGGSTQGLFTIRRSSDGGESWVQEYTNYDAKAYKAGLDKDVH